MNKNITIAVVLAFVALLGFQAAPVYADITLYPTDDTYVKRTQPTTNFDEAASPLPGPISATAQVTSFSPDATTGVPEDIGYLRFSIPALTGTLTNVRLRLYNRASPGPSVTVAVYDPGSNDWNGTDPGLGDETTLVYDNAPSPLGGTFLDSQAGSATPAWMEFSSAALTSYVASQLSGGRVTFVLRVTSSGMSDLAFFEDREDTAGTGNPPELILEGELPAVVEGLTATQLLDGIRLDWRTLSEHKHAGFRVLRQVGDHELELLTPSLIPSARPEGELGGASYRYIDRHAPAAGARYWIEAVDVTGTGTRHGPVSVVLAAVVPWVPRGVHVADTAPIFVVR